MTMSFGHGATLAALLALSACVTSASEPAPPAAATAPAISGTASSDVATLEAAPELPTASALQPQDAAWRELLTKDLVAVESKGDAFLEAASRLCDRLMAAGDGADAVASLAPALRAEIDADVRRSRERYADLMTEVAAMHRDLDKAGVKTHLPVDQADPKDTAAVAELFTDFAAPAAASDAYDPAGKAEVAALIFRLGAGLPDEAAYSTMPKLQRDALSLLDHLRVVRSDLAYVSGTVSSWVHDHVDMPNGIPKQLSGDGPSFPQDVDPSALTHH